MCDPEGKEGPGDSEVASEGSSADHAFPNQYLLLLTITVSIYLVFLCVRSCA